MIIHKYILPLYLRIISIMGEPIKNKMNSEPLAEGLGIKEVTICNLKYSLFLGFHNKPRQYRL